MRKITKDLIEKFRNFLVSEEKAGSTVDKYVHDVVVFMEWIKSNELDKALVLSYKQELIQKYAPASVNATISSLNSFFVFMDWHDIRIKALKIQRQIFSNKDKELTKSEYERLLTAAKTRRMKDCIILCRQFVQRGLEFQK